MLLTDLNSIAVNATNNEAVNFEFKEFLLQQDGDAIDKIVITLNEEITAQIDCTSCGNCCRTLMINVAETDAERLSAHLQQTKEVFYKKYIERSSQGTLAVMNCIPCHFLHENKCNVYKARPTECREFPGLHNAGFTKRLFATFMHYSRCLIVYNVVERLKEELMPHP